MSRALTPLTDQERAAAMARCHLLRPFFEAQVALTDLARPPQRPLRTRRRWVPRERTAGLAGLVHTPRRERGTRRRLPPALHHCIAGLARQTPPLSMALLHRQVHALACQHHLTPPRSSLVSAMVRQRSPALTTRAHPGPTASTQRFDLLHRRDAEGPHVMWPADHGLLAILLLREGHAPTTPWLTVVVDDSSRAMAGSVLPCDAPSARNTAVALRQAIWRKDAPRGHVGGIPMLLSTDCGSDFPSHPLEQGSVDLPMGLTNSLPGQPRGRGRMERCLQTGPQMCLCAFPGYAPPTGPVREEPRLTPGDLDTRCRAVVCDVSHAQPPSDTQVPPQPRWEAGGV